LTTILPTELIQAGMKQIDKVGWTAFHPFQLILEYKLIPPLPFSSREDFLQQTLTALNAQVVQQSAAFDISMPLEERLFEVFMIRFEVLEKYKSTLIHIWKEWRHTPGSLLACIPEWIESLEQLFIHALAGENMEAVGIKMKAFIFFYIQAQQIWFKDESPDLSSTMAALHQAVQRYKENFIKTVDLMQ
jgi:ubiquinone biosynthesis protein COQ9